MSTPDLCTLSVIRQQCVDAIARYEALLARTSDHQTQQRLRRLARHRMALLYYIAHAAEPGSIAALHPVAVEASVKQQQAEQTASIHTATHAAMGSFIAGERAQLLELRGALKSIESPSLRYRLSSYVASLQVDCDLLRALEMTRIRK